MKKNKQLTNALETQNIEMLKELKSDGVDLSKVNIAELNTENKNIKLLKFLIKNGVNVNEKNKKGATSLMLAVLKGQLKTLELLIENDADINTQVLSISALMYSIINNNNNDISKLLIKNGADVNTHNENGTTALMNAILYKNKEISELLIEKGADVNAQNIYGEAALMWSVGTNDKDITELLIQKGADVNTQDKEGVTSLMDSVNRKNKEITKLLIQNGADVNAYDENGITILMGSSKIGDKDVTELLIQDGADVNAQSKEGFTALGKACVHGNKDIAELFIQNGVDVNEKYAGGMTPLIIAAHEEHIDTVKLLIENGADVNTHGENRETALMYASIRNNQDMAELLIENGADANTKDGKGSIALNGAAITGNVELVNYLIQNGADVTNIDKNGNSVILEILSVLLLINEELLERMRINKSMSSYKKDMFKIIKLLINTGTDINKQNKEGHTALISAVIFKRKDLVKLLIKNGADVNYKGSLSMNALMMTLFPSSLMRYVMNNFSYIENTITEIDYAINFNNVFQENNSLEITELLVKNGAILDKFHAWIFSVMRQDIKWTEFVVGNSDINDCSKYMNSLIILSSYNVKDIFFKSIEDIAMKEIFAQMFQKVSPEMYLKIFALLVDSGVDLNAKNRYGHTFLMSAIIHNNITMVEALLKNDINIDIKSKTGFKAIDYALNNKNIRTVLLQNGAKIDKSKSDKKSLKIIQKEISKTIKEETDTGDLDWTLTDSEKTMFLHGTSLSNALKSKKAKDLKKATIKNANLDIVNIIDLVIEGYGAKFIDIALKHGTDKDRQDDEGQTALMHACSLGKKKIVESLIKNGVAIDITDNDGNDVWYYASLSGKEEILELLRNYDELSAPNHNPRELVKILSNFTRDTPMKYTTHDWDFGNINNTEHKDFKGFINAIRKQWGKLEEDLYELSPSLHKKVCNFLLNENKDADGWFGKDKISIGWSSLDGLDTWCNEGNKPCKFKLEQSHIVDNKEISTFGDVINLFKQEIEIRKEHNILEKIFIDIENGLSDNFSIETKHFREKNFYTDIETFKNALSNIFSEIQKRDFPEIQIKAIDETGEYIDISIVQMGSLAQQSSNNMLQEVEDGNFKSIKKLLTNLCDWSIESSFEDEHFRVNYLRSNKNILEIELLDYEPTGFTYRLRFYK